MTPEEIKTNLTEIFKDVFDNKELILNRETTAKDVDDWDSLAQITLIVAIEEQFKIKFSLDDIYSLRNVGDMLDIIKLKIS